MFNFRAYGPKASGENLVAADFGRRDPGSAATHQVACAQLAPRHAPRPGLSKQLRCSGPRGVPPGPDAEVCIPGHLMATAGLLPVTCHLCRLSAALGIHQPHDLPLRWGLRRSSELSGYPSRCPREAPSSPRPLLSFPPPSSSSRAFPTRVAGGDVFSHLGSLSCFGLCPGPRSPSSAVGLGAARAQGTCALGSSPPLLPLLEVLCESLHWCRCSSRCLHRTLEI